MRDWLRPFGIVLTVALVVLVLALVGAAIAQLVIPRIGAARIHARLTEGGGSADVSVRAFPATRLLRNEGDELTVRGEGLVIGLGGSGPADGPAGLAALDGFRDVDIELVDFRTGPFAIAAFVLTGHGDGSYSLATQGTTTAADIVRLGEGALRGVPGGPILGSMAGGLPMSSREVSVSVAVELISEEGQLRVGSGGGSIAGYPAGPIATAIAAAVARRLEIAP